MSKLKSITSFKEEGLFLTNSEMLNVHGSDVPSSQTGYSETCNNNVEDTLISSRTDSDWGNSEWGPWKRCCVSDCTISQLTQNLCP